MKYLLLLALLSTSVQAKLTIEKCENWEQIARQIMVARQEGVPMSDLYKAIEDKHARRLIKEAYLKQRITSKYLKDIRQRYIDEFANREFHSCVSAIKD